MQIQLENLESSVRDRCKKEFTGAASRVGGASGPCIRGLPIWSHGIHWTLLCSTDLMTEMTDLTSDLLGSGIPFLDYKVYAERVFFPGHQESPLHRDLGVPDSRRPTVEQGLGQLSNLLNSKLFLTKVCPQPGCPIPSCSSSSCLSEAPLPFALSLTTVHPHAGGSAYLLSSGPCLCGVSAHGCASREA